MSNLKELKLKPCPFCGETKYLEFCGAYVDQLCGEPPTIACTHCDLVLQGAIMIPGHTQDYFGKDLTPKEMEKLDKQTKEFSDRRLIWEWNTRPLEGKHE